MHIMEYEISRKQIFLRNQSQANMILKKKSLKKEQNFFFWQQTATLLLKFEVVWLIRPE